MMMLCKWRMGEKEGGLDENEVLHSRSCATGTGVREINHLCMCLTICAYVLLFVHMTYVLFAIIHDLLFVLV